MKIGELAIKAFNAGSVAAKAVAIGANKIWQAVKYIIFKDPVVEQICATNWGDGEHITPEQAAKVTGIYGKFQGNTEITSFDELEMFSGLTSLAWASFNGCSNLMSVVVPRVTSIEGQCFKNCSSLNHVNIPSSITNIGMQAFYGTQMKYVDIEDVNKWATIKFGDTNSIPTYSSKKIYSNGEVVTHASIPAISIVTGYLFAKFPDLITVSISDGVETFGSGVFDSSSVETITFPDSVKSLGWGLFRYCKSLKTVYAGKSLETVQDFCFDGCNSLSLFDCRKCATIPTLSGSNAFNSVPSTCKIVVLDALYDEWIVATNWIKYASKIIKASDYKEE